MGKVIRLSPLSKVSKNPTGQEEFSPSFALSPETVPVRAKENVLFFTVREGRGVKVSFPIVTTRL